MSRKKALVAVAHSLLVIVYHVLARRADYRELGGDYFDRWQHQTQQQRLIKRLERMGLKVTVEALPSAA
jgi:peptidyl-tRNA hydrolase